MNNILINAKSDNNSTSIDVSKVFIKNYDFSISDSKSSDFGWTINNKISIDIINYKDTNYILAKNFTNDDNNICSISFSNLPKGKYVISFKRCSNYYINELIHLSKQLCGVSLSAKVNNTKKFSCSNDENVNVLSDACSLIELTGNDICTGTGTDRQYYLNNLYSDSVYAHMKIFNDNFSTSIEFVSENTKEVFTLSFYAKKGFTFNADNSIIIKDIKLEYIL